jgi:GT2 family glycosyltransferase
VRGVRGRKGPPFYRDGITVSVIVVSHEHAAFLPACLTALRRAAERVDLEVIVVDNRSTDGSADVARATYPDAFVHVNDERQGFATNCNTGLARSRGDKVLFLNPDTEVSEDAVAVLAAYLDEHPDVGVCGPQLRFPDGSVQPSCRRFPTWGSAVARRTPLRRFLGESDLNARHLMLDVDHDTTRDVDWMLGAALMARRAAIDDVGPMDPAFFLYVEDIDWCFRMHEAGWRVVYVPTARVVHHHLAVTDRRWLTWRTVVHLRGMARYVRKHGLRAPRRPPAQKPSASDPSSP